MLSKSLARLSSGSKLGSPGDDAAGMAVSMRFDAQINRTAAAASNVGNAISFAQTQDGYLKKLAKALDRMGELAVLAQDVTKTDPDRALYNDEFTQLAAYVTSTATKDFNSLNLFSATALKAAITQLSGDRATIGAYQSRLDLTAEQLDISEENYSAANSRIKDVDMAEASTQFARQNILMQSGTAMLAQANQLPQSVLRLLQ